jgi:hypothetical protein
MLGAGQSIVCRPILRIRRYACQSQATATALSADLGWRCERRRIASSRSICRGMAADTHTSHRFGRTPGFIAQSLRSDRSSRSAGNAHELSRRVKPNHRKCPTPGGPSTDRPRRARRGCGRSTTLPRDSGRERLPNQLSRQSRSWPAPRLDGLLHARGQAAGRVTRLPTNVGNAHPFSRTSELSQPCAGAEPGRSQPSLRRVARCWPVRAPPEC